MGASSRCWPPKIASEMRRRPTWVIIGHGLGDAPLPDLGNYWSYGPGGWIVWIVKIKLVSAGLGAHLTTDFECVG